MLMKKIGKKIYSITWYAMIILLVWFTFSVIEIFIENLSFNPTYSSLNFFMFFMNL